jgi:hypothetical protein
VAARRDVATTRTLTTGRGSPKQRVGTPLKVNAPRPPRRERRSAASTSVEPSRDGRSPATRPPAACSIHRPSRSSTSTTTETARTSRPNRFHHWSTAVPRATTHQAQPQPRIKRNHHTKRNHHPKRNHRNAGRPGARPPEANDEATRFALSANTGRHRLVEPNVRNPGVFLARRSEC